MKKEDIIWTLVTTTMTTIKNKLKKTIVVRTRYNMLWYLLSSHVILATYDSDTIEKVKVSPSMALQKPRNESTHYAVVLL